MRAELGIAARAVDTAREAVRDRDVVVLATTSPTPVLSAADLRPGTHVNAVGFKQLDRAEFGTDLLDAATVLASATWGAVLAGTAPGRTDADQISVFCSVGLAGTEVFLLDRVVRILATAV